VLPDEPLTPWLTSFSAATFGVHNCLNVTTTLGLINSFLQAEDVTFDLFPVDVSPFQSHCVIFINRFGHSCYSDFIFPIAVSPSAYAGNYSSRSLLTQSFLTLAYG
jgi:hypothetical protein